MRITERPTHSELPSKGLCLFYFAHFFKSGGTFLLSLSRLLFSFFFMCLPLFFFLMTVLSFVWWKKKDKQKKKKDWKKKKRKQCFYWIKNRQYAVVLSRSGVWRVLQRKGRNKKKKKKRFKKENGDFAWVNKWKRCADCLNLTGEVQWIDCSLVKGFLFFFFFTNVFFFFFF